MLHSTSTETEQVAESLVDNNGSLPINNGELEIHL